MKLLQIRPIHDKVRIINAEFIKEIEEGELSPHNTIIIMNDNNYFEIEVSIGEFIATLLGAKSNDLIKF
ncbi:hypothetical protein [Leadbetterella byssophila]|uniref:hypothetical protein n=1 Tax=Leadbetterella byssophila TaxID=316068 RepID=UPI0039A0E664